MGRIASVESAASCILHIAVDSCTHEIIDADLSTDGEVIPN